MLRENKWEECQEEVEDRGLSNQLQEEQDDQMPAILTN